MLPKSVFTIVIFLIVAGMLSFSFYTPERKTESAATTLAPLNEVPPAQLTTETWGVFDPKTGDILAGSGTDEVRPIASLTKLFTAYAVLESAYPEKPVTITWSDVNAEGRAGKLAYGQHTTMHDLLFPLLLESSNDAGAAILRTLGDEFSVSLEDVTKNLALASTHIEDATGLCDCDVSDIRDLTRFYAHLRNTHPHALDITQLRLYVGEDTGWVNSNPARSISNFTGGKHGFTEMAGRTFIGTFKGEHAEIGVVLLGSRDLHADIESALAYVEAHPVLSVCYNAGTCPTFEDKISYSGAQMGHE